MEPKMNEAPAPDAGGAAADQAGGAGGQPSQEQMKQVTDQISNIAMQVIDQMQKIGTAVSELGIANPDQVKELAGAFQAFMQTLQGILGQSGEEAPADQASEPQGEPPMPKGNQPVDNMSGGKGVPVM